MGYGTCRGGCGKGKPSMMEQGKIMVRTMHIAWPLLFFLDSVMALLFEACR